MVFMDVQDMFKNKRGEDVVEFGCSKNLIRM